MFGNPEKIIEDLHLKSDMRAADFGCGSGGWTIPLAEKLDEGLVYAIDLLEEPLSALKGKLEQKSLANVKTVVENIEKGVSIRDRSVDLVLMTNFLFQVEDREKVISEAKRVLRKEGVLLITEWSPDSPIGLKLSKINPEEVRELVEKHDFYLKESFSAGLHHYGFIYKKK